MELWSEQGSFFLSNYPGYKLLSIFEALWISECLYCERTRVFGYSDDDKNITSKLTCCDMKRYLTYSIAYDIFSELYRSFSIQNNKHSIGNGSMMDKGLSKVSLVASLEEVYPLLLLEFATQVLNLLSCRSYLRKQKLWVHLAFISLPIPICILVY